MQFFFICSNNDTNQFVPNENREKRKGAPGANGLRMEKRATLRSNVKRGCLPKKTEERRGGGV